MEDKKQEKPSAILVRFNVKQYALNYQAVKVLLVVLAALSYTTVARSQTYVYHPFPELNAYWTVDAQGCCASNCPPPPNPNPVLDDFSISYYLQGDTVIDNDSYHKIHRSGTVHSYCAYGNYIDEWSIIDDEYMGAYRQDINLKQVFFISPFGEECILYDFSLNPGDTLDYGCQNCPAVITSIDSVLVGNNYRRKFNLSTSYSIIEGIGSTSGLLEPLCPFEYFGTLICFVQDEQTLYPDTTTTCELITRVKEIKSSLSMSFSPNPFYTQTTLKTNRVLKNATLKICNVFGQEVKQMNNINGQLITLTRGSLPGGMYIILLIEDNKTVSSGKFIAQGN